MNNHLLHLAALATLSTGSLHAALVAYEPFNYSTITNGTTSTAAGFSGGWIIGQGGLGATTNLNYPGLATEAGAAKTAGAARAKTTLANPITEGIVYATLLLQASGNPGGDGAGLILTGTTGNAFVGFGAGFSASETGFGLGAIDSGNGWGNPTGFSQAANISNTAIHYLALLINLDTNNISLWIDPTVANVGAGTLGAPNLTISSVALGDLTGFGVNAISTNISVDEVRIGDNWAFAGAVPEPSSALLIGLAGFGLLLRRRQA